MEPAGGETGPVVGMEGVIMVVVMVVVMVVLMVVVLVGVMEGVMMVVLRVVATILSVSSPFVSRLVLLQCFSWDSQ